MILFIFFHTFCCCWKSNSCKIMWKNLHLSKSSIFYLTIGLWNSVMIFRFFWSRCVWFVVSLIWKETRFNQIFAIFQVMSWLIYDSAKFNFISTNSIENYSGNWKPWIFWNVKKVSVLFNQFWLNFNYRAFDLKQIQNIEFPT